MTIPQYFAIGAAVVLAALMIFQLLLAAGLPLGKAAWGGAHRVLPTNLRWGSFASFFVLGIAAWSILARAGLVAPGAENMVVRVLAWVFAGFMVLNTAGNLASKSPVERKIMTPLTVFLVISFGVVALS